MWFRSNKNKNFVNKKRRNLFKGSEFYRASSLFFGSCSSFSQRIRMKNTKVFSSEISSSVVDSCVFNGRSRSIILFKMSRFSFHKYSKNKILSGIQVVGC